LEIDLKQVSEYKSYHALYMTAAWRARRLWQLQREPCCKMCLELNHSFVLANTADHIIPHKGNKQLFWDKANLQSLCETHHNEKTKQEQGGPVRKPLDIEGWPKTVKQ
jgi:5-methylcytosine-specific restriction enzyme A